MYNYRNNIIGNVGAIELGKSFFFLPRALSSFTLHIGNIFYFKIFIYFIVIN